MVLWVRVISTVRVAWTTNSELLVRTCELERECRNIEWF